MINVQKLANDAPLDTLIQYVASLPHAIIFDGHSNHHDSQYSLLTACPESIQVLQRTIHHRSNQPRSNQQEVLFQHLQGRPIFKPNEDPGPADPCEQGSVLKDPLLKDYTFEKVSQCQSSYQAARQYKNTLDAIYSHIQPFSESLTNGNSMPPHLPFIGGLMGYLSYDFGCAYNNIQRCASSAKDNKRQYKQPKHDLSINDPHINLNSHHSTMSLAEVGLYSWAIIEHHPSGQRLLIINKSLMSPTIRTWLNHWLSCIHTGEDKQSSCVHFSDTPFSLTSRFGQSIGFESYQDAFTKLKGYIQAGHCYQTNLTQRFSAQCKGPLAQAFIHIKQSAQSPFMGLFQGKNTTLLSLSPERFVKCHGRSVETKPIKGTCKRSKNPKEDQKLALDLQKSIKNQAENVMIVDLLRNDLAINCLPGSVKVPKLFALESFPNVHHLVSTIQGTLKPESTPLDLLFDAFPGGSITGAPKNRAMEIIDELETHPRGPYCGSLFYLSTDGNMDSNILIRSFVQQGQHLYCWAGGGIVSDSEVHSEYQESLDKVQLFIDTLESRYLAV